MTNNSHNTGHSGGNEENDFFGGAAEIKTGFDSFYSEAFFGTQENTVTSIDNPAVPPPPPAEQTVQQYQRLNQIQRARAHFDYVEADGIDEPEPKSAVRKSFCLLYTSPSPRDLSTSRMPSSA